MAGKVHNPFSDDAVVNSVRLWLYPSRDFGKLSNPVMLVGAKESTFRGKAQVVFLVKIGQDTYNVPLSKTERRTQQMLWLQTGNELKAKLVAPSAKNKSYRWEPVQG